MKRVSEPDNSYSKLFFPRAECSLKLNSLFCRYDYRKMIWSSARMGKVLPVSREFSHSNHRVGDSSSVPGSAITQRLILKNIWSFVVCILSLYAAGTCLGQSSAETNFTVYREAYDCSTNIICLGKAHSYIGNDTNEGGRIQVGRLSLLADGTMDSNVGVAYYHEPIKFLDISNNTSYSFNTSFVIDKIKRNCKGYGDGLAFVISADNSTIGSGGGSFGMFHDPVGTTPFTSIIVEFDTYLNPPLDINNNHVSFDFGSFEYAAVANVTPIMQMGEEWTIYAWVEYSYETKLLEARVSDNIERPISPLVNYTVDLFNHVEEYMWVGFSSGSGVCYNNYYIGDWTFESFSPISIGTVDTPVKSFWTSLSTIIVVSVVLPTFVIALIAIFAFMFMRSNRRRQVEWDTSLTKETTMQVGGMPARFSYKQLSLATNAFSEDCKLGQGGFGSVYRGVLPSSGIPVAVKKINSDSSQGEKEFMAEVSIINRLRHRNLIQLLGWCKDSSHGYYLLAYELMPNGSLDKSLFGPTEKLMVILSWEQRFNIVTGIAAALDYLHQGWTQQIIHRDVKASNIMLDKDWNAKLGDFGLARLVDHQKDGATTAVVGTYGYIAPELPSTSRFTDKTDVFAFGAVVLEVACGRKALRTLLPEGEVLLVDWVWQSLSNGDLMTTVDERLKDYDRYWMEVMLKVGLLCSHPDPLARPSMRHVVQILAGDVPIPSIPTSKPIFVYNSVRHAFSATQLHNFQKIPAAGSTIEAIAELHDSPSTPSSNPGPLNQIKGTDSNYGSGQCEIVRQL